MASLATTLEVRIRTWGYLSYEILSGGFFLKVPPVVSVQCGLPNGFQFTLQSFFDLNRQQ